MIHLNWCLSPGCPFQTRGSTRAVGGCSSKRKRLVKKEREASGPSVMTSVTGSATPFPKSFVAEQTYSPARASEAEAMTISSPSLSTPSGRPVSASWWPQLMRAGVAELASQWNRAGSPRLTVRTGGVATGRGGVPAEQKVNTRGIEVQ